MRNTFLLFLLASLLITSCSKMDELESPVLCPSEAETRTTRDENPVIIPSPPAVCFTVEGNEVIPEIINVKIGKLPSLGAMTSIQVSLRGRDATMFYVVKPELSLSAMLDQLLGNGLDISVGFLPSGIPGDYEAELLIETSILGIRLPSQTVVPLCATYIAQPVELLSTFPAFGEQILFVVNTPEDQEEGYYYLTFTFNQPVSFLSNYTKDDTQQLIDYTYSGHSVIFRFRDCKSDSPGSVRSIEFQPGSFASNISSASNVEPILYSYLTRRTP